MISFSEGETRRLRLQAQRLLPGTNARGTSAAEVVRGVCGLQSQETNAAVLGVRARSTGLKEADVRRALFEERSLVRTWGPRGTLHLLASDDLGWMVALLGPIFAKKNKRRYRELGLDDGTLSRGVRLIRKVLAERGPLHRAEIGKHLAQEGIPTEGQALIHLISRAALEGYVCLGPDQGNQPAYVLVKDWINTGPAFSQEIALEELARRYLSAYEPASPADFAVWSGLGMGDARRVWEQIAPELAEVTAAGDDAWMLSGQLERKRTNLEAGKKRSPSVRLLPRFDTYLLGYASRELVVPAQYTKRINAGGGIVHAAVLVDGRAGGTWRIEKKRDRLLVQVEPFITLNENVIPALQDEVSDIGRFYEAEAMLQIHPEAG